MATILAYVPSVQHDVVGPSHTWYSCNPLCVVEDNDVEAMVNHKVYKGCSCNGNRQEIPMFATLEDIKSGKVVPEWPPSLLAQIKAK